MAKLPLVGFTYPTITGESKLDALKRIAVEFPKMQVWSHYWEPGKGYPTFTEAFWDEIPDTVELVLLSVKDRNVDLLVAGFPSIPERWRGKVAVTINHEPDQWRSTTDDRGDPDPETWWALIQQLLDRREGSVWETWVLVYVCFTEDRFRTARTFWEQHWGSKVRNEPRLDLIAWDVFNIGRTIVRTGADMFTEIIRWTRALGKKAVLREYGQVTPKDQPTDSAQVVAGIADHWEVLKRENEVDDIVLAVVWYYNHKNTLADPEKVRRPQTLQLLQQIVEEAYNSQVEPEPEPEQPNPTHPQYRLGYDAGVAEMRSVVDQARATGRVEGRTDVVSAVLRSLEQFATD